MGDISNFIIFYCDTTILFNASSLSYSKSANNFKILVSPSNKWCNNSSLLFSTSSFNLSVSFIFTFTENLNSLSFSKSLSFLQNLHLSSKVVLKLLNLHLPFLRYCLFHHLAYLTFFLFHFLFHLFLVLLIILVFYFI